MLICNIPVGMNYQNNEVTIISQMRYSSVFFFLEIYA